MQKAAGPTDRRPSRFMNPTRAGRIQRMPDALKLGRGKPQAIRGQLIGDHTVIAPGFATCTANTPILELARLMVARGVDPRTALEIYRGKVLAIRVRSIGEAANLRTATHGTGFEWLPRCTGAPPIAQTGKPHGQT